MKKSIYYCTALILGLFLALRPPLIAQTPDLPGWQSQTPLPMSENQCFERAQAALRSVGLQNQTSLDNWHVNGTNYNVRASIGCVSCGDGVFVTVTVAATQGYSQATSMRNALRDYMKGGTMSSPDTPNLAGKWTYAGTRGKVDVKQNGDQVTLSLTISPRSAPSPHYIINARLMNTRLEGTWAFTVDQLTGADKKFADIKCKSGRFYAELEADGQQIKVLNTTEDPCGHKWAGTVLYKK